MNASELIDKQIADLADWRGERLAQFRKLVHQADPDIIEEWKWSTAVWTHKGLVCAGGVFKDHVKLNFFNGANLKDPHHLFRSDQESKKHRSIDFRQADKVHEPALKDLIKEAVSYNLSH